jgi:hypothetical protein
MERTGYVRWLLAALMLVSGLMFLAFSSELLYYHALWSVKAILLLRNALLVAVPAVYLLERRISPSPGPAAQMSSETRLKIRPSASS